MTRQSRKFLVPFLISTIVIVAGALIWLAVSPHSKAADIFSVVAEFTMFALMLAWVIDIVLHAVSVRRTYNTKRYDEDNGSFRNYQYPDV